MRPGQGVREREEVRGEGKERGRERGRKERERERGSERERESEGGRERDREGEGGREKVPDLGMPAARQFTTSNTRLSALTVPACKAPFAIKMTERFISCAGMIDMSYL